MSIEEGWLHAPLEGRKTKPRPSDGVTMVIDKGMSLDQTRSWLDLVAPYVDFLKLGFGSIALYPKDILRAKLKLAKEYQVQLYPGGTFFEIAQWQDKVKDLFGVLKDWGVEWLEISDGSIDLPLFTRKKVINDATLAGFHILTEVGKKDPRHQLTIKESIRIVHEDLKAGASWVILEARESGKAIGIYDQNGCIIPEKIESLAKELPLEHIIWEAPLKSQQADLISSFGTNVNLGNVPVDEAFALEALRQGYRNDTLKTCLL